MERRVAGSLWAKVLVVGLLVVVLFEGKAQGQRMQEEAERLNQQVLQFYQKGHYREAITLAQRVLAIWEQVLGAEHFQVTIALYNLATLYHKLGAYVEAESLYQRALDVHFVNPTPVHFGVEKM